MLEGNDRDAVQVNAGRSDWDLLGEFADWILHLSFSEVLMLLGGLSILGWIAVLLLSLIPRLGDLVAVSSLDDPLRLQIVGWVLLSLGLALVTSGSVLNSRARSCKVVSRGAFKGNPRGPEGAFASVKLGDSDELALLRSIRFPHGTQGREVWMTIEVDGRYYPQPITIGEDGTIENGYLQFGAELERGNSFDLGLFSLAQETGERLRQHFKNAVKDWTWDGMSADEWPQDAQALFRASFVRE